MSEVQISDSVDEEHLSQIEQICQQLEASGMNVEETLSIIGVVR